MQKKTPRLNSKERREDALRILTDVLKTSKQKRFLIIGDVMMDVFVRSRVDRISPEAPVPLVVQESYSVHLGGAGNTASNIAGLGAYATLIGVVGKDIEGRQLAKIARTQGVEPRFLIDESRPTITKTRVVARDHHIVRIDRETLEPMSPRIEKQIISTIQKMPVPDWVIISDYAKGLVTKPIVQTLKKRFGQARIVVDPKPANAHLFKNVGVMKVNATEGLALSGIHATTNDSAARAARVLSERFNASIVLTRGEYGMTILDQQTGRALHIPTYASVVRDVTGAGDTAAAVLTVMLSHGMDLYDAAHVANLAASIAVSRHGTSTVSVQDILHMLQEPKE